MTASWNWSVINWFGCCQNALHANHPQRAGKPSPCRGKRGIRPLPNSCRSPIQHTRTSFSSVRHRLTELHRYLMLHVPKHFPEPPQYSGSYHGSMAGKRGSWTMSCLPCLSAVSVVSFVSLSLSNLAKNVCKRPLLPKFSKY